MHSRAHHGFKIGAGLKGVAIGALAATALMIGAAGASAATVRMGGDESLLTTVYVAARGEANRLTVSAVPRPTVTFLFTDLGALLGAGRIPGSPDQVACVRRPPPHRASCVHPSFSSSTGVLIYLGDRSDTARVSGVVYTDYQSGPSSGRRAIPAYSVFGRAGNDVITTGPNAQVGLFGGIGADRLTGGGAADRLVGGPGSDRLFGGAGVDVTSYADHARAVRVDLRRAGPQGSVGERDFLYGIESVVGGPGRDVLTGNAAPNTIDARAGNDTLNIAGGGADTALCGPGFDTVRADLQDHLVACERVIRGG